MGQKDPKAISLEWLENRYGCGAAQIILDEIANADNTITPANDDHHYPEMANKIA